MEHFTPAAAFHLVKESIHSFVLHDIFLKRLLPSVSFVGWF